MVASFLNKIRSKYVPKGSSTSHVLTVMTGATLAQAISLGFAPILTRLYTPHDYGVLASYTAVSSLIAIISTGRYELAIMLPKEDHEATNLAVLSVIIAVAISLLTLIIVWIFNTQLTSLLGIPDMSKWLYIIPVSVLLTGVYQTLNYLAIRKKRYNILSMSRINASFTSTSSNVLMGYKGFGVSGLIVGGLLGQSLSTGILGWQVIKSNPDMISTIRFNIMKETAIRYKDFPRVNSLHAFVDTLQSSGVVFLISYFFSSGVLGFYSLTMRVLKTPLGLIGSSVAQVFYQRATETYNHGGDLKNLVIKTMVKLSLIALPIQLIIGVFAPSVFSVVFGDNWKEAGEYAQILSPWIFCSFVISPVSQVPIIVGKQKHVLLLALIGNSIIFFSIFIAGISLNEIKTGFYLLSSCMTVYMLGVSIWIIHISKGRYRCLI